VGGARRLIDFLLPQLGQTAREDQMAMVMKFMDEKDRMQHDMSVRRGPNRESHWELDKLQNPHVWGGEESREGYREREEKNSTHL
jgi:hypothetical protein